MAEIGTATLKVTADTKQAEAALKRLSKYGKRLSWPDVGAIGLFLAFTGFVIEKFV